MLPAADFHAPAAQHGLQVILHTWVTGYTSYMGYRLYFIHFTVNSKVFISVHTYACLLNA